MQLVALTKQINDAKIRPMKKERMTKARSGIVEVLKNAQYPLTAMEIKQRLSDVGLSPDKATIYRQIEFLLDKGQLREVRLNEDVRRFEFGSKSDHVHHLICNNCEKVANVELDGDLVAIEKHIADKEGFDVQDHTLEFYGICKDCSQTRKLNLA